MYRDAGWRGVLPLPPASKFPPPKGFTGYDGAWPTNAQIDLWIADRPADSNLMLRLNHGLVGIDVDAYDDKTGGRTLEEAESRWGALPPTYRSSARADDEVSGHRVFRVPEGILFRGRIVFPEMGIGDIDTIQPHLRYITAYPSIHPKTGQPYRWYALDGSVMLDTDVPRVDQLPELPPSWIEALSQEALRETVFDGSAPNRRADAAVDEELLGELTDMSDNGLPDDVVDAKLSKAMRDLTDGTGSRYDTVRDHTAGLMRLHFAGRQGVPQALGQLRRAYSLEVSDTRSVSVAEAEFRRFTEGAALLIAASAPGNATTVQSISRVGITSREGHALIPSRLDVKAQMVTGGSFVLDLPAVSECVWGSEDKVVWANGEGLMVTGTQGVGKTTLAQQLTLGLVGLIDGPVLGFPLARQDLRVLYLAMDRPNQIARAFRRRCRSEDRLLLDKNLVVWPGPPPADLAKNPELLTAMAAEAGAGVVVVDSLKDAAMGLSEDEVGAAWNRAAQGLLASGRNLVVLHHRKKQAKNARTTLDDVYGSTWLTSGMGSVVLLDGNPGDPVVEFRQLKSPASEVGPMKVSHDQATGLMTVATTVDLVATAQAGGGITVKEAANLLFGSTTRGEVEKARRKLDNHVAAGALVKKDEGGPVVYYPTFGATPSQGGHVA